MAELIAGKNIGHMHLDAGQAYGGDGVADGVAVMSICAGVDYYAVTFVPQRVQAVDYRALAVGLEEGALKPESAGVLLDGTVDAFQRVGAVDPGFAFSRQIDVWTVDYGDNAFQMGSSFQI